MFDETLARAVPDAPGFRWMKGIVACYKPAFPRSDDGWKQIEGGDYRPAGDMEIAPDENGVRVAWPDLDDPATAGCLLALVHARWPDAEVRTYRRRPKSGLTRVYEVRIGPCRGWDGVFKGESLGEALARALLTKDGT